MGVTTMSPFRPEALDANRRGELSDQQRRDFGALSRYTRRNELTIAAFLVAGALLIALFAAPTSSAMVRGLVTFISLTIAAFLIARSVTGSDALARDLRRAQVQSVEGAIGKRRPASGGRSVGTYFLDVGDRIFKVAPATYDAAPEAGIVRVYFLPRSRKIVNLERLSNPPLQNELTPLGIVESLGAAVWSHNRREANEARAGLASVGDALKAAFAQSPAPTPDARDPRPLSEAIIGTWSNTLMKVRFSADGSVTINMIGTTRDGHWSVDGAGRLRADITGRQETADAWVAGNHLTITVEGKGLTFTRESGA